MKFVIRCTLMVFLSFSIYSQEKYTDVSDLWNITSSINDIDEPKDKTGIKYIIKETISFYSEDKKPFTRLVIRKYDKFGKLLYINNERQDKPLYTKRIFRSLNGQIDSTWEYTYSDTGMFGHLDESREQSKSISYYDEKGRIQSTNKTIWKTSFDPINYMENIKFIYDEKFGQIKSRKVFEKYSDGSGGLDHSDRYIYDDDLLLEKSWVSDRQNGRIIDKTLHRYYDDRSLKNIKIFMGSNYLTDEYKFEYYSSGELMKTTYLGLSESVFEFDKHGKLTRFESINLEYPERDYIENISYDDDLITQITHIKGGKTTRTNVENRFNQNGQLSEVKIGIQMELYPSSPRKREYTYDDQTRIVQKRLSTLNSENKYVETFIVKYHYIDY